MNPSGSIWAAAAQNSIGNRTLSAPTGLAPGAFSAIAPARSFGDFAQSGPTKSVFDAPSGSNDFDMSGLENEAAVLGGTPSAFGAPRPATNAFGSPQPPTGFGQPTTNTFGQPMQPATNAFGQPIQPSTNAFGQPQPSTNAFGQPVQPQTNAFGQPTQPSTNAFGQPATSAFGQPRQSAFGAGGMGMPAAPSAFGPGGMGAPSLAPAQPSTTSAFGSGGMGAPSPAPVQPSGTSAFGAGGMGPPSGAPGFGQPAQSSFGQPAQSSFGQPKPSPFAQPTASTFGRPAQTSAFGAPAPSAFGSPAAAPVPAASSFGQPQATPSPLSAFAKSPSPAAAVAPAFGGPPSSAPVAGSSAFGAPNAASSSAAPASSSAATTLPTKSATDAFFKSAFAKKPETPSTPPSAPAAASTTPQNTPPPRPVFGKALPAPVTPESAGSSGTTPAPSAVQAKSDSFVSNLMKKTDSAPVTSTPQQEQTAATSSAGPESKDGAAPPVPADDKGKAAATSDAKEPADAASLASGLGSFSLGPKKADSTDGKEKEKGTVEDPEAAAKDAEAFKAFRKEDPFARFKQAQGTSWLDAPAEKADWEIKLEESKKKREAAGLATVFDNSAFTTAQIDARRKQRAEEHQLEHDESDEEEEEEEKEKEDKFSEDKMTNKEPAAPKVDESAAEGSKLNLSGLAIAAPIPEPAAGAVEPKIPAKIDDAPKKDVPSTSTPTLPLAKSPSSPVAKSPSPPAGLVGLGKPPSRPGSAFAPVKSSPLATPPIPAGQPAAAVKPSPSPFSLGNLAKKLEESKKTAATPQPAVSPPPRTPLEKPKPKPEPAAPAAGFPSLGSFSASTSKKAAASSTKSVQPPAKPAYNGGWPEEPVPKFTLAPSPSSNGEVESTAKELEKARLAIDEGLRQIRDTVEQCKAYNELLKKPSKETKGIEHISEFKHWNFADAAAFSSVVNELQAGLIPLKDKTLQYRRMSVEVESLLLKAETKKEECARFNRALDDKDYEAFMRIRHLGPEQSENQAKLRHSSLLVHNQLERLEDYVTAMKAKVLQHKNGSKPLTGPALDTVNRTIRNLDTAAATELATLEALSERLQAAKDAYRAQLPAGPVSTELEPSALIGISDSKSEGKPQKLSVSSKIASARLKAALLAHRSTPIVNTMARQVAVPGDSSALDGDLSLAIYKGPLTLDMAPQVDEVAPVVVKEEEPVKQIEPPQPKESPKQTVPPKHEETIKLEETMKTHKPTTEAAPAAPGPFNFSGPLPASWEALKNAPYKPLVTEAPRPGAGRHGHRHAAGDRSALRGRESHGRPSEQEEAVVFQPVNAAPPTANVELPKAPAWPSLPQASSTPVTPLGSLPPLVRKDFLGSLPPVKKDSIATTQSSTLTPKTPATFVPLLGQPSQTLSAQELQEKARQAWGSLGTSTPAPITSKPAASLIWKPPQTTTPVASASVLELPAAWKAAFEVKPKPSPSPSSISQPTATVVEEEKQEVAPEPVSAAPAAPKLTPFTPWAPAKDPTPTPPPVEPVTLNRTVSMSSMPQAKEAEPVVTKSTCPVDMAKSSVTQPLAASKPFDLSAFAKDVPSMDDSRQVQGEGAKSPTATSSKQFDFAALTKNAAAQPKAVTGPSFSELLKKSGVSLPANASASSPSETPIAASSFSDLLKKAGVSVPANASASAPSEAASTSASLEPPKTPPQTAKSTLAGVRSPPLQAFFGGKSSVPPKSASPPVPAPSAPKSAFGPGGSGMASTPKSAFGPGGVGIPSSSAASSATGSGNAPAAPVPTAPTPFKSAFGAGGMGAPSATSTTPPTAKSPPIPPIGGAFGMHSAGASGAFNHSAARSIFAKPEGWTPPASSADSTNFFKPVTVPTATSQSGNPDWAKRAAEMPDTEEDEEEDAEGEPDPDYEGDSFNSYQDEVNYSQEGRDLSDLEEADEEYDLVDQ